MEFAGEWDQTKYRKIKVSKKPKIQTLLGKF